MLLHHPKGSSAPWPGWGDTAPGFSFSSSPINVQLSLYERAIIKVVKSALRSEETAV